MRVTMYQLPPGFGLPVSVSPFCAKLECYLRLTGREYTTKLGDIRKSPSNSVPYVTFDDDPTQVGDSATIIAKLEAHSNPLDAALTDAQLAECRALTDRVELDLYYPLLYSRFADPAGWEHQKAVVHELLPWFLRWPLTGIIRNSQISRCQSKGFTEPGPTYAKGVETIEAIAQALADKPFILGDAPHVVDCAMWGPLMHASKTRSDNPLTATTTQNDALMAYIQRVAAAADLAV